MKEFWKSINNWQSYRHEFGVLLFWDTVYRAFVLDAKKSGRYTVIPEIEKPGVRRRQKLRRWKQLMTKISCLLSAWSSAECCRNYLHSVQRLVALTGQTGQWLHAEHVLSSRNAWLRSSANMDNDCDLHSNEVVLRRAGFIVTTEVVDHGCEYDTILYKLI